MRLLFNFCLFGLIIWLGSLTGESTASGAAMDSGIAAEERTIKGVVLLAGRYIKPLPLPVFKNRSFCGSSVANETLLVGVEGGLRNAVVLYIRWQIGFRFDRVILHSIIGAARLRPMYRLRQSGASCC